MTKLQTSYKRASKIGQNMWGLLVKEMQTNAHRVASLHPPSSAKCWQGSEGNRKSECQLWQNWRSFWKAIWNHLIKVNTHISCRLLSPLLDTRLGLLPKLGNYRDTVTAKSPRSYSTRGKQKGPGARLPQGPSRMLTLQGRATRLYQETCPRSHSSAVGVECEKPPNVYRQNRPVTAHQRDTLQPGKRRCVNRDKSWKHTMELTQFTRTVTPATHAASLHSQEQKFKFIIQPKLRP